MRTRGRLRGAFPGNSVLHLHHRVARKWRQDIYFTSESTGV